MPNTPDQNCQKQLQRANQRLEDMSVQTDSWFWETDENHRFNFFTQNLERLSSLRIVDLVGTSRLEMAQQSQEPHWKRHANDLIKRHPFKDFQYTRKSETGEVRNILVTGWPIYGDAGEFCGYRGTGWDETDKINMRDRQVKKEEQLLSEIERQRASLDTVLQNLDQSVLWFDHEGYIRLNNSRTAKLLGFDNKAYRSVATIQQHLTMMATRGDFGDVDIQQEVADRAHRLCVETTQSVKYRIHLQHQDRYLDVSIRPLADGSRILTHTDVTAEAIHAREAKERDEKLKEIISNMEYGVVLMDEDLTVEFANSNFCKVMNFKEDFIASEPDMEEVFDKLRANEIFDTGDMDDVKWREYVAYRRQQILFGESKSVERKMSNGRIVVETNITLTSGKRMLTFSDVTELKSREAQFEMLVNNIDYATLVIDKNQKVELWNSKFGELMKIGNKFLSKRPSMKDVLDKLHGNDCSGFLDENTGTWKDYRDSVLEALKSGGSEAARRLRRDGKIVIHAAIELPEGKRLLTYLDVTAEAKKDAEIQEREAILSTLIDNVDQGILLMDKDLNVELRNEKFCEMWGTEKAFFDTPKNFIDIMDLNRHKGLYAVDGANDDEWNDYVKQRVAGVQSGKTKNAELVRGDGKTMVFSAVHLPGNKRMTTYFDITDLKQREVELNEMKNDLANANEMLEDRVEQRTHELRRTQATLVQKERQALLGNLVASLCHELRNPLNALNTSMFIVRRKVIGDFPKLEKAFNRSERTIERCTNILNDLYEYAITNDAQHEQVDIELMLKSVIEKTEIPKQFKVEFDLDSTLPLLNLDEKQICSAIGKVISNAAQAIADNLDPTARSPKIVISANQVHDKVEICVADNGPGMDSETLESALEPLFSTRGFGVGLGLPIAEQTFKRHNGGVEIMTKVGSGTTVKLWLPAEPQLIQAA